MVRANAVNRRLSALPVMLAALIGLSMQASGAEIFTGTGAGAYVGEVNQYATQTGSTPASVSGTATFQFTHFDAGQSTGTTTGSFTASASAIPGSTDLLQLHATFSSPGGGAGGIVGVSQPGSFYYETADWSNVGATVTGPAGSPLPTSVQLEFQVNYYYSIGGLFQPQPFPSTQPQSLMLNGYPITLTAAGTALQPGETPVQAQPNGSLMGSFHVDLPLSSLGTSPLFSLSLNSQNWGLLSYPGGPVDLQTWMSLSMTGIYLPDGTALAQDGYNITFDSGQTPPPSVIPAPEPTTLAAWCLMTAFAMVFARSRNCE
jgi:hypothetical protein